MFGQHIFLGSYLALLVPLAAARLEWAWRGWRAPHPKARACPCARSSPAPCGSGACPSS